MDNLEIAQYYLELLKAFKSVKKEMGEDSPYISFQGNSLEKRIEEVQGFLSMDYDYNPLGDYECLSIGGDDTRIYEYEEGLRILVNVGDIEYNKEFYTKLIEYITFPLIIEDHDRNSMSVNRGEDS